MASAACSAASAACDSFRSMTPGMSRPEHAGSPSAPRTRQLAVTHGTVVEVVVPVVVVVLVIVVSVVVVVVLTNVVVVFDGGRNIRPPARHSAVEAYPTGRNANRVNLDECTLRSNGLPNVYEAEGSDGTPTREAAVHTDTARMVPARADLLELSGWRRGLPVAIVSPTGDAPIDTHSAAMVPACADLHEAPGGRRRFPVEVVAPARRRAVFTHSARVFDARIDVREPMRGWSRLPGCVRAPARNGAVNAQTAGVAFIHEILPRAHLGKRTLGRRRLPVTIIPPARESVIDTYTTDVKRSGADLPELTGRRGTNGEPARDGAVPSNPTCLSANADLLEGTDGGHAPGPAPPA
jgi:hypothetical protein